MFLHWWLSTEGFQKIIQVVVIVADQISLLILVRVSHMIQNINSKSSPLVFYTYVVDIHHPIV